MTEDLRDFMTGEKNAGEEPIDKRGTAGIYAGKCATCGTEAELFVYALPGIPMSVGNCLECFQRNTYPLYVVEAQTEALDGLSHAADWWKRSVTYSGGRYLTVAEHYRLS